MSAALEVHEVKLAYGPAVVAESVSLELRTGDVVTILGSNGAGKSTLARAVAGLLPVHRGRISLNGEDITGLSPRARLRQGISLVPEDRCIFPGMSVLDNLRLGSYATASRSPGVESIIEIFPGLSDHLQQRAGLLSGGEQQMLAIGRALMSRPSVLILDEPSLGLAPKVTTEILRKIKAMAGAGLSVLLIEQNLFAALDVATHGAIFERGRLGRLQTVGELRDDPTIVEAYLGRAL